MAGVRFLSRSKEWTVIVEDGEERHEIPFDPSSGEPGWNFLGTFELYGGEVRVLLTDKAERGLVAADAIRWSPTSGGGA